MNLQKNLLTRLVRVKMLVFDVDGVLTDGGIFIGDYGESKRFNVRDGMGIALARRAELHVAVLTARKSESVRRRAEELKIDEVHQGVADKLGTLLSIVKRLGIDMDEVLYMGDDINDLPVMGRVGVSVCPADAARDVKDRSHHVTLASGGHGAVREIVEIVLRNQEKWADLLDAYIQECPVVEQ